MITANQLRAARALLDISQGDIAQAVGVSPNTISNIEKGSNPAHETAARLQNYFETRGVEFTDHEGVRRKPSGIITYRGREGFAEFIWDVYETVKREGGEICVSNVDEDLFTQWLDKEVDDQYMANMKALHREKKFEFKILIQEGDDNFFATSHAQYRWLPKEQFGTIPFYVYGNKLAFLIFGETVTVHVIDNTEIAHVQRIQFNVLWDKAIIPKGNK